MFIIKRIQQFFLVKVCIQYIFQKNSSFRTFSNKLSIYSIYYQYMFKTYCQPGLDIRYKISIINQTDRKKENCFIFVNSFRLKLFYLEEIELFELLRNIQKKGLIYINAYDKLGRVKQATKKRIFGNLILKNI